MNKKEELLSLVYKFKDLSVERTNNGVTLIGKNSSVKNNNWLNKLYPILSIEDCGNLELQIGTNLPLEYKVFLTEYSNGLNILLSTLSIYGLRKETGRTLEYSRQPYSVLTPNLFERPTNAKENFFFIGGYNWDGSHLYIDKETNKVHFCNRWDATSLLSWASLEDMLLLEIERIYKLFDENGIELNDNIPTIPM
jgi:hypothetical protein